MPHFTKLEMALMQDVAGKSGEIGDAFRKQIATCRIMKRGVTGAGFYTHVEIDRFVAPAAPWKGMHASGFGSLIGAEADDVAITGIIWFDEYGYMTCLEAYQLGDATDKAPVDLRDFDMTLLDLRSN